MADLSVERAELQAAELRIADAMRLSTPGARLDMLMREYRLADDKMRSALAVALIGRAVARARVAA